MLKRFVQSREAAQDIPSQQTRAMQNLWERISEDSRRWLRKYFNPYGQGYECLHDDDNYLECLFGRLNAVLTLSKEDSVIGVLMYFQLNIVCIIIC